MASFRIATLNVLFHDYYLKYCKGEPVPLAQRTQGFKQWVEQVMEAGVDVLALQEWPYGGEQGELWNDLMAEAAHAHGYTVISQREDVRNDGLLCLVQSAQWKVEEVRTQRFTHGRGSKRYTHIIMRHGSTGLRVGVVNAHVPFGRSVGDSCKHVREMFEVVDTERTPYWVGVGDWNMEVRGAAERALFKQEALLPAWVDHTEHLEAATCAADRGMRKYDYIVSSPAVRAVGPVAAHPSDPSTAVHHRPPTGHTPTWFSDHVSLTATLQLLPQ
eukprot:TRINITY_DN5865_c0_g1_i5.p1 TRINITY_DN5865_c0_g1~~TRINITY_DN5865_c0_g1_i5.p1  ORF type:complete len:273 (+),score=74.67 TRINITY_DN5865_c0_g1_i5:89-907(+)